MHPTPIRLSLLLAAVLLQAPAFAQAPPGKNGPPPAMSTWHERLDHDWDLLRGRPGPVHQALAAARRDLRTAGDERFLAKRNAQSEMYLRRVLESLHTVRQDVRGQWLDPTFAQRLSLVTNKVGAMATGSLAQTPALYDRLAWELGKLLHWRWAP